MDQGTHGHPGYTHGHPLYTVASYDATPSTAEPGRGAHFWNNRFHVRTAGIVVRLALTPDNGFDWLRELFISRFLTVPKGRGAARGRAVRLAAPRDLTNSTNSANLTLFGEIDTFRHFWHVNRAQSKEFVRHWIRTNVRITDYCPSRIVEIPVGTGQLVSNLVKISVKCVRSSQIVS